MTGVAQMATLVAGTKLYHGSPANEFTHDYFAATSPSPNHFEHRPVPDTPAWFALNVLFSLHAAARFTPAGQAATFTLHTYTVAKTLNLYSLDDMNDFAEFMVSLGEPRPTFNAKRQATPLAKLALEANIDGYVVQQDIVRQEPEYVLFGSGLAKLGKPEPFELRIVPQPMPGHLPARSTIHFNKLPLGAPLATYDYTGGPGTLT
jgi:hypothetical protein